MRVDVESLDDELRDQPAAIRMLRSQLVGDADEVVGLGEHDPRGQRMFGAQNLSETGTNRHPRLHRESAAHERDDPPAVSEDASRRVLQWPWVSGGHWPRESG
jgi:hypothetical protein